MSAAAIAAAALIAEARKRVINNLLEQGAITPGTAAPVNQAKRDDRDALRRLVREGAVVSHGDSAYHLDEAALAAADVRSRRNTYLTLGVLAATAVAGLLVLL